MIIGCHGRRQPNINFVSLVLSGRLLETSAVRGRGCRGSYQAKDDEEAIAWGGTVGQIPCQYSYK